MDAVNRIVGGIQHYGAFREIRPIEGVRAPVQQSRDVATMKSVNGATESPAVRFGGSLAALQPPKPAQAPAQTGPGGLVNIRV